ncbi:MAG: glycosyltransferase family 39 protein [bacterium]
MAKKKKKGKKNNETKNIKRGISFELVKLVKKEYVLVGGILLVGILLRLVYIFQLKNNDPYFFAPHAGDDTYMYVTAAKEILEGTFPKTPFGYNPLYYYFLSLCYLISGYNLIFPRVIQFILGVITCLLTYLIGKQLFNKPIGMIGALLCAVCGTLIFYEGVLLSTALTTFFSCASLFFFLRGKEEGITKNLVLGAVCLGLATLSQPNVIIFLPFILIWMLITYKIPKKEVITKYAIVLLAFFITISPVTIRNCIYGGKFILLTTAGGFQFWIGNNEHANASFDLCQPYLNNLQERMKKEGKELYVADVLDFVKREPVKFIKLQLKKFLLLVSKWGVPHQTHYEQGKIYSSLLRLPIIISFDIFFILGLTGIFFSLKSWKKSLLLYGFIFAYSFSVILFVVIERYRPPVLPIMAIFTGFLLYFWYEKFRLKYYKPILLSLILLFLCSVLTYAERIYGLCVCFTNPNGVYTEKEECLIIKDCGNLGYESWREGNVITLEGNSMMIKKELIINRDISSAEDINFVMTYMVERNIGGFIININGISSPPISCANFYQFGTINSFKIKIASYILKKGLNIITLKMINGAILSLPIDTFHIYGRSYFSENNGKDWVKIKGEYQMGLEIKTKEKII